MPADGACRLAPQASLGSEEVPGCLTTLPGCAPSRPPARCRADPDPRRSRAPPRRPQLSSFDLTDDQPFDEPPYSTWDVAQHGPTPYPDWVITDHNALDTELGILKTGKEA